MRTKAFLSAFAGFLYGLIAYIVLRILDIDDALAYALLAGLGFHILLFLFLVVYGKIVDRRYKKIENGIPSPVFYQTNGNIPLGNGKLKNGNIYFCETGIVCICLEEKPYMLAEISLQNIERITYTLTQLNIYTNNAGVFVITVPKANEIVDLLVQKGWIMPG